MIHLSVGVRYEPSSGPVWAVDDTSIGEVGDIDSNDFIVVSCVEDGVTISVVDASISTTVALNFYKQYIHCHTVTH